jgi:tRNA (pseudouridine54-N1)-methyltransferase
MVARVRRFVVVGQKAKASADFLLVDIPSTSGRLDVLLHALRAALLFSHGVRHDSLIYLVLLGLPERPCTARIAGAASRYLRPDERSLATTLKKVLALPCEDPRFTEVRPGLALAAGGLETLLPELSGSKLYLLEPGAPDLREQALDAPDQTFVLGDHLGLTEALRAELLALGATPVSVGPKPLHSADVIALVHNELDRRGSAL